MDRLARGGNSRVQEPLSAPHRFGIAADVARALHYLHAEASPPLIHQDMKSDNVILAYRPGSGVLMAKVADFGTARIMPAQMQAQQSHHSTRVVVGTTPYVLNATPRIADPDFVCSRYRIAPPFFSC